MPDDDADSFSRSLHGKSPLVAKAVKLPFWTSIAATIVNLIFVVGDLGYKM